MTTLRRATQQTWQNRALKLAECVAGIMICYILVSYFQEKLTKETYGDKQFIYMQTLVLAQCTVSATVAFVFKAYIRDNDNVPLKMYSVCSVSYVLAMLCSYLALEYVSYPTQVLAKSCKPIPILIAGVLFAHKSYPWRKYTYILIIVIGMAFCMYKEKHGKTKGGFGFGQGEMFLLMSLVMDGATGAIQDVIRHYHVMGTFTMMFFINTFSSVFMGSSVILTGELFQFVKFAIEFPYVLGTIMMFAIMSAAGQMFIFKTVTEFGPLTCSILTNVRKLVTVVLSIILFNHPYSYREMFGATLVFTALFLDAWDSKRSHHKRSMEQLAEKVEK